MKNQREIYQALLAGKTVVRSRPRTNDYFVKNVRIKLNSDGFLVDQDGRSGFSTFERPDEFEVFEPKYTYEQIQKAYLTAVTTSGEPRMTDVFFRMTKELEAAV